MLVGLLGRFVSSAESSPAAVLRLSCIVERIVATNSDRTSNGSCLRSSFLVGSNKDIGLKEGPSGQPTED